MRLHNLIFLLLLFCSQVPAQIASLTFDLPRTLMVNGVKIASGEEIPIPKPQPFFTLLIDSNFFASSCGMAHYSGDTVFFEIGDGIAGKLTIEKDFSPGIKYTLRFTNRSHRKHSIENLIPLGEGHDRVYITADGTKEWPAYLCRSRLYRPGYGPVGIVLPDNAWHLGYSDIKLNERYSLTGLARRSNRENADVDRWAVTLKPGGWVEYSIYFDMHKGDWRDGLKMFFQERKLYDLTSFNDSLFQRKDLQWMRNTYIMLLQFAWDDTWYDAAKRKHTFYDHLTAADSLLGGYDMYTIWPTWPRLGLDQRNQWDMYRDLPGGIRELRKQSDFCHKLGKRYFISYNPWDESTRKEDHLTGMAQLLKDIDADGVVLDTRGASSIELQQTADKVRPGIIMYSEGMAVPKDMPGIVSGRVHDALFMPPPLNMNKFIKPDFAIFRVLQISDGEIHREVAVSFFNGYGVEINTMRPGRPSGFREELRYLGQTTKILRENNSVFHNSGWTPLISTRKDSVYVNKWISQEKTIYTVYSLRPEGLTGALFPRENLDDDKHYISLWNHVEIDSFPEIKGKTYVPVDITSFKRSWLNSRKEGQVECIAVLPRLLQAEVRHDSLWFLSSRAGKIVITAGNPSYSSISKEMEGPGGTIKLSDYFGFREGKFVVQLFDGQELLDEKVVFLPAGTPRLMMKPEKTTRSKEIPSNMILIPSGKFRYYTVRDTNTLEPFIQMPNNRDTVMVEMNSFLMDAYPVTNMQFAEFLRESRYKPDDTTNFLRHWKRGKIPQGLENHPVVYVSPDDAKAYAKWAGKRLPTEMEWQYAAQGEKQLKYPWGNKMDSTKCNFNLNHTTPVDFFPSGESAFGVRDMIGNVWQLTSDVYYNGCYYYTMIRGGSYYHPQSSIWYITGGALPADHPEILLLISPCLDRNATVGFRCIMDKW